MRLRVTVSLQSPCFAAAAQQRLPGTVHQPYRCNEPRVLRGTDFMQTNLLKPKAINVEPLGGNRAKVTLEPFERGYGHTLGNALRRVLLSSMVGYAPTEVTIAGVLHEYSSIDGVQEDVVDIMLNLKGVVFRLHNRDEVTLALRKEGEGPVTAARHPDAARRRDHQPRSRDRAPVAGGKLDMQIKVEKGRGYVPGNDAPLSATSRPSRSAASSWTRRSRRCAACQLHRRKRPRRAAYRPRQAGHGDRDQRRDHAGRSDPPVGQDPGRAAGRVRAAGRQRDRRRRRAVARSRSSIRSCCVRSTSSS